MADGWVVDKGLDVLLGQINAAAPNRSKASDGSIGDAAHQAGTSDHNPQDTADSSDGGDPDNQVDARDFTHDPAHNADMGKVSESIRRSRDRRVRYVIFNGRICYGYLRNGVPAFTWQPYTGSNLHREHMHVSVNDVHNDETQLWQIGIDAMATAAEVKHEVWYSDLDKGAREISAGSALLRTYDGVTAHTAALAELKAKVDALAGPVAPVIDYGLLAEALRPILREEIDKTTLGSQ